MGFPAEPQRREKGKARRYGEKFWDATFSLSILGRMALSLATRAPGKQDGGLTPGSRPGLFFCRPLRGLRTLGRCFFTLSLSILGRIALPSASRTKNLWTQARTFPLFHLFTFSLSILGRKTSFLTFSLFHLFPFSLLDPGTQPYPTSRKSVQPRNDR